MVHLAALLSGLGGLLVEIVLVRRHGLLLGNTAGASALVLSLFLLGLGVGGLLVGRLRVRPARAAAGLYALVAASALASDALLRGLGAVSWPVGLALAGLAPGLVAVAMGAAFPLLFALIRPGAWASGALIAANLAGSVAGTWLGGNVWIPALGLTVTLGLGAAAYGGAALLLLVRARREPAAREAAPPRHRLPFAAGAAPAFAAGLLVLGLEILLLRRLPFWLESLQSTLSGVLAACLLGLTAGAALGAGPLQWVFGRRRAPAAALALGAVAVAAAAHEIWGPALARLEVRSDVGVHLRIAAVGLVAAFVPCFALGAVVPLLAARLRHPGSRAALVGRLFFWHGAGGIAGAVLVGAVLPWLLPRTFLSATPIALAVAAGVLCWRHGALPRLAAAGALLAGVLGLAGAPPFGAEPPPIQGSRYDLPQHRYRYRAHRSDAGVTASVVYAPRTHSMLLFTDGFRAAETGPGTAYMKALGHLPLLLRRELKRVAVIALGTGTTADALAAWPEPGRLDVVEISPAVYSLVGEFGGDGPAWNGRGLPAFARDPRTHLHLADGRRFLARHDPGTLDLVTLEPLLPYAPGTAALYSAEFYQLAKRTLSPEGLMVQWVPTHAMPVEFFDTLVATFGEVFPHTSIWLVDQATILVGSTQPHLPSPAALEERFAALADPLRAALHECGLARAVDVQAALVGEGVPATAAGAPTLRDDRPFLERVGYWSGARKLGFYPENLARLEECAAAAPDGPLTDEGWRQLRGRRLAGLRALAECPLRPGSTAVAPAVRALSAVRSQAPDSVLLHREETAALRALVEREVVARAGATSRGGGGGLARSHLQRDLRSATLQAAAALPDPQGRRPDAATRRAAVRRALALDPALLADARTDRTPGNEWEVFVDRLAAELGEEPIPSGDQPGPLEAVDVLPGGAALAELVVASGETGAVVAAVFGVRVARAFTGILDARALTGAEQQFLRAVLDPLSLDLAARAIAGRDSGGLARELIPLWRSDLPMPVELAEIVAVGDEATRLELARALRDHRGSRAVAVLADLLEDSSLDVRLEAAVSLFGAWGDRVPYDPEWDESRRRAAAEQVRSLHNRRP